MQIVARFLLIAALLLWPAVASAAGGPPPATKSAAVTVLRVSVNQDGSFTIACSGDRMVRLKKAKVAPHEGEAMIRGAQFVQAGKTWTIVRDSKAGR